MNKRRKKLLKKWEIIKKKLGLIGLFGIEFCNEDKLQEKINKYKEKEK